MSDVRVREALLEMEAWLADPAQSFETLDLGTWNEAYQAAVAGAERGPGWEGLVALAHSLGEQLEARLTDLECERDAVKLELGTFARGDRALRGYRPNPR